MKNKKAMFFSVAAIAVMMLFLFGYETYSIINDSSSIENRIKTLDSFVFSVEKDISRQIYIFGFRTIFLIEKRTFDSGTYITGFDNKVNELYFNGSFEGEEQEIMIGARFSDMESLLYEQAKLINANLSIKNPNIVLTQTDPWNIKAVLTIDLMIADNGGLIMWNKTHIGEAYIPIQNFEDPMYIMNTNGIISNKINRTIYFPFSDGSSVTNLSLHAQNSYYTENTNAPSFLKRLVGENTADENGIESLVYLPKLSSSGLSVKEKSVVDYIYFSSDNPTSYKITGMQSWFRLDSDHLDDYQVNGLEYI